MDIIGIKSNKITFRANEETISQLEEIRRTKYPRATDTATVLRWMIADTWGEINKTAPNGVKM
jgi:hypothetical protein